MSKIIYDVIQRFEVENGVPRLVSTNIQVIQGGEDLMSLAIKLLAQLGFYDKFEENRTSQYIGYKLKHPKTGNKRYQIVLQERKEGLYISIPRDILKVYLLELKFSTFNNMTQHEQQLFDWLVDYVSMYQHAPSIRQMMRATNLTPAPIMSCLERLRHKGYLDWTQGKARTLRILKSSEFNLEQVSISKLLWVRPSQEDLFFQISSKYNKIFKGEVVGTFDLGKLTEHTIEDYIQNLLNSDCCLPIYEDTLFPYTSQVSLNGREVLEEFIDYFCKIIMEQP